jgi:hypothetical protein
MVTARPSDWSSDVCSSDLSTIWKDSEILICGSYDGKISIWEISEKASSSEDNAASSTISP